MAKRRAAKLTGAALDQRRAELTDLIERDLAALAPDVIGTLFAVAASPPPPAARELMFEVFEAGSCLDAVYRVLGERGFIDQVEYGKVFDNEPLPAVISFAPADVAIEVEWRLVREALFRRFPGWWVEAGGERYPLPVRLAEHDLLGEQPLAWAGASGARS